MTLSGVIALIQIGIIMLVSMSALVIIMSIGTKRHFKREAVKDTAGIGTRE